MERRQGWMRDYLIEQGQDRLAFVASAKPTSPPLALAAQIKNTLELTANWAARMGTWTDALRYLERRMEQVGILVVVNGIVGNNTRRKLNVEEFRGFVLVDAYAPLVFINGADAKAAQMFTLAHELVHLWLGKSAAFDLRRLQPARDATEQLCNRTAAEFLVPEAELRRAWPTLQDGTDHYQQLARQFKVSELVAARRALDLHLIDKEEFFRFYSGYLQRQRRMESTQKGGNFYATQNLRIGRRFASAVARAVGEGELLYREAYNLTGLHGAAFERYMASLSSTEAA
jgi:Zn-dependent peptidase ImmA (M78 family)